VKNQEISEDEIYDYIENFTDQFKEAKLKLLLHYILCHLYRNEGPLKGSVDTEVISHSNESYFEIPENRSYPENLNVFIEKIMQRIRIESQGLMAPEGLFPQIFIEGGFILFFRLVMKYTKDDKSPVAKFSNLYHFFKYEQILTCTQLEYISFIESHYDLKMSKIMPANHKYTEVIKPMLERMLRGF
jgi:hypothetical protein